MSNKKQSKENEITLRYIEVPATVDADVTVDLETVLRGLNLEELRVVRDYANDWIKVYEEEEDNNGL